jgi:hypothetical protein
MKPMGWKRQVIKVLFLLVIVLSACTKGEDSVAGRGSETENEIQGVLVTKTGAVVAGARVYAFPADTSSASPTAPIDSTVTDGMGVYTLKALNTGTYNLVGEYADGPLAVFIPEVQFTNGAELNLGVDTMKAPGGLDGKVLKGVSGLQGVLVYIPGTSNLAITDATGFFKFDEIPEGVYQVNYQAQNLLHESISGVEVLSGLVTHLPVKVLEADTAEPPPTPVHVEGILDTLLGQVHLNWSPVDVGDIFGYRVYLDKGPLTLPLAISPILRDTFFTDTSPYSGEQKPKSIVYRIRSVDKHLTESIAFSEAVEVAWADPTWVSTTMQLKQEVGPSGMWMVNQPLRLVVEFSNPTRRIKNLVWSVDDSIVRIDTVNARQGWDTLQVTWSDMGYRRVKVAAEDEGERNWFVHHHVQVGDGRPSITASKDTVLSIGDSLHLTVDASDLFHSIAHVEWDIGGTGNWVEAPQGKITIKLPGISQTSFPCIVKATNSVGLVGMDTLHIDILADQPIAKIQYRTTEGFPGDTLLLSSAGSSDRFGSIVRYEWQMEAGMIFGDTDKAEVLVGSSEHDTIRCVLRVTDDDGQVDTAEVELRFIDNRHWAFWGSDSSMKGIQNFRWWADADSIYVMGDLGSFTEGWRTHFWSSSDMIRWNRTPVRGFSGVFQNKSPARHAGKLWILNGFEQTVTLFTSVHGIQWDHLSSDSFPTLSYYQELLAFNEHLWLFGLRDSANIRKSEVWKSKDGLQWSLATDNAAFGNLMALSTHTWDGRLWFYGQGQEFPKPEAALYSSVDGANWVLEAQTLFPGTRGSVDLFTWHDELWLMSTQNAPMIFWGELRHSSDGKIFSKIPLEAPVLSDYGCARAVVFKNRLWLMSSNEDKAREQTWKIWQSPLR